MASSRVWMGIRMYLYMDTAMSLRSCIVIRRDSSGRFE